MAREARKHSALALAGVLACTCLRDDRCLRFEACLPACANGETFGSVLRGVRVRFCELRGIRVCAFGRGARTLSIVMHSVLVFPGVLACTCNLRNIMMTARMNNMSIYCDGNCEC